jgi:UDP-3-O-[3-hydroxymyristoyl] glucosamine N-acyltransferase
MKFTAKEIAQALNGTVEGNENAEVDNLSKIEEGKPGTLSFLANPKYTPYIYTTDSDIVIVSKDFEPEKPVKATLIRVEDPYASFASLLEMYQQTKRRPQEISKHAYIAPSAKIGNNVFIGEFVSIGENSVVGDNCQIFPNTTIGYNCKIGTGTTINAGCKIYDDTVIGNNCILHAGVVIGSDGFGFAPQQGSNYKKIPQIGNVIIEDFVEIGSNSTIDRATLGSTIIRKGVKLDNLIQVAHNVEIGENTVIAAMTGISGSTKIGKNCMIGGQVGFTGHITIADEVKIGAQSGISKSITKKGALVEGSPAFNLRDFQRSSVHFRNFDRLVKRINELERKVNMAQEK